MHAYLHRNYIPIEPLTGRQPPLPISLTLGIDLLLLCIPTSMQSTRRGTQARHIREAPY